MAADRQRERLPDAGRQPPPHHGAGRVGRDGQPVLQRRARTRINSKNSRLIANLGFILTPFTWGNLRTNIGSDGYTNENLILRHPGERRTATPTTASSTWRPTSRATSTRRRCSTSTRTTLAKNFSISGLVGNADLRTSTVDRRTALEGSDFLDPNFVSINNTSLRTNRTTLAQRRLVSVFGQATLNYQDYLYLTATGRNDWTSTIPQERNSFFYPSVSTQLRLLRRLPVASAST